MLTHLNHQLKLIKNDPFYKIYKCIICNTCCFKNTLSGIYGSAELINNTRDAYFLDTFPYNIMLSCEETIIKNIIE